MSDPVKTFCAKIFKETLLFVKPPCTKFFKEILCFIINAWQTKSFGFAFWGVFVLGSIGFSFLLSVIIGGVHFFGLQKYVFHVGWFSLWGYIYLAYYVFSVAYVYRKASLLRHTYCKLTTFLLGIYIGASLITFVLVGEFSLLFLFGKYLYKLAVGTSTNYLFAIQSVGEFSFNVLKCAADLSNK